MAALTPSSIVTHGADVNEFSSGTPMRVNLTLSSVGDSYTHPTGVKAWAYIPDTTDVSTVSFAPNTRVFTITSAVGTAKTCALLIWPAK